MRRDKYLCQECRRNKRATPANEVDHIIPKEHGGTDELNNLEAKCTPCHRTKTAKEKKKGPQKTSK
nr:MULTISPECIES: HNH endonuclease signature motif containing protein [unclassified Vibrio]